MNLAETSFRVRYFVDDGKRESEIHLPPQILDVEGIPRAHTHFQSLFNSTSDRPAAETADHFFLKINANHTAVSSDHGRHRQTEEPHATSYI
jgi:hypothetical protein